MANIPCPKCREKGEDKTGDHLYRAMDGDKELDFWVCRKCNFTIGNQVSPETPPVKVQTTLHVENDNDPASYAYVSDRGIHSNVRRVYKSTTECDPATGLPVKHYYPITKDKKIVGWKIRDISLKKFYRTKGTPKDIDLFGMLSIKGRPKRLILTEGEEDAMAAHMMMSKYNVAAVSLPDGTGSIKAIKDNLKFLNSIPELILCHDQDEPGEAVVKQIVALLPDIKIVQKMSEKDANDMLLAKKEQEFIDCVFRAEKFRPPSLVRVEDVIEEACKIPEYGRAWPWPSLTKLTYGMRDGEGIYVGAGVKIGKSEFINELVLSRITSGDGDVPAVIKFEEQPHLTIKKLAGKKDLTFYHRPDITFDLEDLEKTLKSLRGTILMYKAFGRANWDDVKAYIRYAVSEGAKTIIIDPVTKLTNHMTPSETETELRRISDEIACMAHDLKFFYIITCHLKPPKQGVPHEKGGAVESSQFRGSRAMMENCYYMLGIERDKDPTLHIDKRNTSHFVLLDDRAFGQAGRFPVFYDKDTGTYQEPPRSK